MAKKPASAKQTKPRPPAGAKKASAGAGKGSSGRSVPDANLNLVPVIATIKSVDDLNLLPQLAKKLAGEGMTVKQVMPLSGAISGSLPADQLAAINQKVPGVVVERELTAQMS